MQLCPYAHMQLSASERMYVLKCALHIVYLSCMRANGQTSNIANQYAGNQ